MVSFALVLMESVTTYGSFATSNISKYISKLWRIIMKNYAANDYLHNELYSTLSLIVRLFNVGEPTVYH